MNIQALMKQAQQMQKQIMNEKNEIDNMEFEGKNSCVVVKVNGRKQVLDIKIVENDDIKNDFSLLSDMLIVAFNDAFSQVDKITSDKMGKYSSSLPGIF